MIDPQAITDAVWAARGPSIWTRKEGEQPAPQPRPEAVEDKPKAKPGVKRREYDTEAMLQMHLAGATWREIGRAHNCCGNTAQKATMADFAHRVKRVRRDPQPASRLVLRTKADAVKTARIQGTGVSA